MTLPRQEDKGRIQDTNNIQMGPVLEKMMECVLVLELDHELA